ncbi:MAG: EamA family transporter, partial [Dehalococcoidales bacterium]|nr:EamA family transporter [Dehalococcoidales bacterium]
MITWPTAAVLSAAVFAVINIIDSHLIARRLPSLKAFMLPVGTIELCFGLVFLFLFPFPAGIDAWPLTVGIGSGILRIASGIIMIYFLKKEEVARIIPVVYTYPIFVALLAMPLLGEALSGLQWLAVVIVVAGAVIVSFRQRSSGTSIWPGKAFFGLLGSSILLAAADLSGKYALDYLSYWNMACVNTLCIAGVFYLISLRPAVIQQVRAMPGRNGTLGLILFNEVMVPVGLVLAAWALANGPASLVSTITSSRPIFVYVYAFILNLVVPRFLLNSGASAAMKIFQLI